MNVHEWLIKLIIYTLDTVGRCYKENNYTLCPHTAVGVAYQYNNNKDVKQVYNHNINYKDI